MEGGGPAAGGPQRFRRVDPPNGPGDVQLFVSDPPPDEDDGMSRWALIGFAFALLTIPMWSMFLVATGGPLGVLLPIFVFSTLAIVFGALGLQETGGDAMLAGRGFAVVALVIGIVHTGGIILVVMLLVLLGVLTTSCQWSSSQGGSTQQGGGCCFDTCCRDCETCCADCGTTCDGCCNGCDGCCTGCDSCCDGCCDSCGDGCCTGCDCGCDGCCAGCDCGGCDCGGACCTTKMAADHATTQAGARRDRFAHHPDRPEYEADVYRLGGHRFCIGCFTTFPVFLLVASALVLAPPALPWWSLATAGIGLALFQVVSSAGLARRRYQKVAVKTALGTGLAMALAGVLASPWPEWLQVGALLGLIALAGASAIPRARRMRGRCACEGSDHAAP